MATSKRYRVNDIAQVKHGRVASCGQWASGAVRANHMCDVAIFGAPPNLSGAQRQFELAQRA
jgi:hypothetical protein